MKYKLTIKTRELIPPLEQDKYFTKGRVCENFTDKIICDLGEVWGKTIDEAEEKMKTRFNEWLEKNG